MKDRAAGRRPYPSDVSDEEWSFIAPYLTLMDPDAPQREHSLRDLFNALRWIVRSGAPWRYMPSDFPIPQRSSSTAGSCSRHRRAGLGQGTTVTSGRKGPRCISPWIGWEISW